MSKATGSIDLKSLKVAGEPNKYVTFIDSTNGIRVHKAGETNSNFAQINSYGLQVYKGGQTDSYKVAEFGETSYIGKHDGSQSYMRLDSNALQMIDKEGHSYFEVKDLRDNGEFATVSESFPILPSESNPSLPDIDTYYVLKGSVAATSNVIGVKINGTSVSNWQASVQPTGMCIKFTSTSGLTVGDIATVSYQTSGSNLKALTFGSRGSSNLYYPGGYSVAMGDEVIAEGDYSFASGYHTKAYGIYSAAMGMETIAGKAGQVAIGEYNERDNDALFVIGNGIADDNRSNALTVDWNGNIMAQGMAGMVQMFAGSTAPTGWLICNGAAVSRTTYATLFAVIGTTYGAGDGSTTFNLPNLQGRVAIGVSSSHTLASTGGAETVTLTAAQSGVPAHSHTATGSEYFVCNDLASANNANVDLHSSGTARRADALNSTANVWHHNRSTANNTAANASAAHNNMQPFITMNYIICTGKTN